MKSLKGRLLEWRKNKNKKPNIEQAGLQLLHLLEMYLSPSITRRVEHGSSLHTTQWDAFCYYGPM